MPNLLTVSKSFLEWAQSLPDVVIPAGLESDMQEAITSSEAVEHTLAPDGACWWCEQASNPQNSSVTVCPFHKPAPQVA